MRKKMLCLLLSCTMVLGTGFQAFGATPFCIGSNYSVNANIPGSIRDTIPAARYASRILNNLGYDSTISVNPTYATFYQTLHNGKYEFGKNDDGTKYTESNILYFNGEGDGSHIAWWAPWSVKDDENYENHESRSGVSAGTKEPRIIQLDASGIDSDTKDRRFENDLSDVDLMILMGCNSFTMAKRIIPDDFRKYQPQTIVGFNSTVNTDDVQKWSNAFIDSLALGNSVKNALNDANNQKGYNSASVSSASRIQGNSRLKIRLSNRSQANSWELITDENGQVQKVPAKNSRELDEIQRELDYERSLHTKYQITTTNGALTFDFNNPDYTPIADYIKQNIDENFDLNTYQTNYSDYELQDIPGTGFVEFTLLVNGIPTDISYMAFIESNIVDYIDCYKKPVYNVDMSQIPDTLSDISEQELKDMAVKQEFLKEGFYVTKQEIEERFDTDSMKIYYVVLTTYKDNNGYETIEYFTYGLDK